jgi:putative restriction endonuclease
MTAARGKPWTRDELIVVMNLYCRIPFGRQDSGSPEVIELASALGRTPGSVAMKLNNLTSLDPQEAARGVKGLRGASRLDRSVWDEFHADWEALAIESEQLREQVHPSQQTAMAGEDQDPAGQGHLEAERAVKVRLAQRFFRRMVLTAYHCECCVSGNPVAELLVASHILPWASYPEHRVDPRNGLCLSRLHDGAFDQGLIAFDDDYRLLLSKRLRDYLTSQAIRDNFAPYEGKALDLPEKFCPDRRFLAEHREAIFAGC